MYLRNPLGRQILCVHFCACIDILVCNANFLCLIAMLVLWMMQVDMYKVIESWRVMPRYLFQGILYVLKYTRQVGTTRTLSQMGANVDRLLHDYCAFADVVCNAL